MDQCSRLWLLTIGGAEIEELKTLRILGVTLDSKLTFETNLRKVVSKVAKSLSVVNRARKLFDCPRVFKSCYNAYFCPAGRIVPPCLIWVIWIVFFVMRKGCVRVNFVVWDTKGRSVPCVCSIRSFTEWTAL